MKWYVVHTFSGHENSVKRGLEERIKKNGLEQFFGEILVPSEKVTERRGKTTIQRTNKLMPGYMFIEMDLEDAARSLVQNTPKVTGFLGGQKPRPVRATEMAKMLGHTQEKSVVDDEAAPEAPKPTVNYSVGEQVRVKSGAFANFNGEVKEVNADKQKIWLSVMLFGRATRVEVDFSEVEKVG